MDAFRNQRTAFPVGPRPKKPTVPKAPAPRRVVAPKPIDPNVAASNTAMSVFRTALAQLNASTPAVDAAAIRAPYAASQAITGQLGQGYQQAEQQAGAAAQQQYATGRDQAQQHAAAFGISAGAGANPTALTDNGTQALASQTAAYTAAAPAATAQWQALLERTAGAKVSDAELQRSQGLTSARQSLSTSLPSLIANEKDFGFKQGVEKFNEGLARTQLTNKQNADLNNYNLDLAKAKASAGSAQTTAQIKRDALNEKTTNDAAKLRVSQDSLALKRRSQQATASGLKGIAAATKALSGSTSKAGTKLTPKGWLVTVGVLDPDTGEPTGDTKEIPLPDKRHLPTGPDGNPIYKFISAKTNYQKVPTSAGSAGMTASQWDVQMRSLLAQNPGRSGEIKRFLGPRPKK